MHSSADYNGMLYASLTQNDAERLQYELHRQVICNSNKSDNEKNSLLYKRRTR